jgi:formylglycine-generating enzyme required for sulfatase activity
MRLPALLLTVACVWTSPATESPPPDDTRCERNPRDGCWLRLPAAEVLLGAQSTDPEAPGYDPDALPDEGPVRTVSLPAFWISRNEAPTGAWNACQRAGRCDADQVLRDGPFAALLRPEAATLPVNGLSWKGAGQLCAFLGGRLPTEDEWERAARGTDARRWPWGNEPGCGVRDPNLTPQPSHEGAPPKARDEMLRGDCLLTGPAPHNAALGESPEGAVAMAGSLWEWTSTPGEGPGERRVRGGGWLDPRPEELRTTARSRMREDLLAPDVGVRCVWGTDGP